MKWDNNVQKLGNNYNKMGKKVQISDYIIMKEGNNTQISSTIVIR